MGESGGQNGSFVMITQRRLSPGISIPSQSFSFPKNTVVGLMNFYKVKLSVEVKIASWRAPQSLVFKHCH
jgi:hypothetical protein